MSHTRRQPPTSSSFGDAQPERLLLDRRRHSYTTMLLSSYPCEFFLAAMYIRPERVCVVRRKLLMLASCPYATNGLQIEARAILLHVATGVV